MGGLVGAGAGRLAGSGLEARDRGLVVRGASGSMKLFSSVSSCGGLELSSPTKVTKTWYDERFLLQAFLRLTFSVWLMHTFVAEVVLASSSVAGGAGRAWGPMFVRSMPPPVSPVQMV